MEELKFEVLKIQLNMRRKDIIALIEEMHKYQLIAAYKVKGDKVYVALTRDCLILESLMEELM